ncbi:MAG: Holliday junction branch migration DNA helicase RuvB [Proteobacteria bacterium]|nr:Holliday junction branch migration DNA helicase RuvB [Pseudomonadota bacterium]MCP4917580.1 Holliday junction branch migration DNA helicase RuvB [Pseudomonadota bacterium]
MIDERLTEATGPDDPALRPRNLDEYIGQERIKRNIQVYIRAALNRGESLDHVLLAGPPGLGKTSLAYILGEELGVEVRTASGPTIERQGDLAAILNNMGDREILFIDEIHRLNRAVEEVLYPAMEDYELDVVLGSGPAAQSVKLPLQRFTLVGATTRSGLLTSPLRARFGIQCTMDFYTPGELQRIIERSCRELSMRITEDGARELAGRCRGTPRVANRLLKRVRDFAEVEGSGVIDLPITRLALERLEVDQCGLDGMDIRILEAIAHKFDGGPVGISNLAAAIGEESDTIESVYEPFLIQQGFVQRTSRGRILTRRGCDHIGVAPSEDAATGMATETEQETLF